VTICSSPTGIVVDCGGLWRIVVDCGGIVVALWWHGGGIVDVPAGVFLPIHDQQNSEQRQENYRQGIRLGKLSNCSTGEHSRIQHATSSAIFQQRCTLRHPILALQWQF
jgi:hypothetical protein